MADRFRHYSLFYNSKKVGAFNGNDIMVDSGDEPQFGDEGYAGHSDGAITSTIDADAIVATKGTDVTILEDMLAKKYVTIGGGIIDGKILTWEARIKKCQYTSNAQNGTLTGKFSFEGGPPKVTG